MDYRRSDPEAPASASTQLVLLRNSIRGGNWEAAESLAHTLQHCELPATQSELGEYLNTLKQTLIAARASRSNAAAALARIRAASKFQTDCGVSAADRQDFGGSSDSCRSSRIVEPMSSAT
jgi:hypothetical protein